MDALSALAPFKAAYGWLRGRFAKDYEKRERSGLSELVDVLRHSHFKNSKYLVTVFMKSGRSFSGFVETHEPYVHKSWIGLRGHIVLTSAKPQPDNVHYETVTILIPQIEAVQWQNVHGASADEICKVAGSADRRF